MPNFIVIKDNKVDNIINAPSLEIAEEATGLLCIEYTNENSAQVGYTWDGYTFISPIVDNALIDPLSNN